MAARGTAAKEEFINSLLQNYSGAFRYEKEIRVPIFDATSGETVQLKIAVTCAKENVEGGSDSSLPTSAPAESKTTVPAASANDIVEPSKEDMDNIKNLISKFNL